MILAGLTCVAHGRPLPGNLGLGTDCLLMGRQYPFATPDPLTGWSRPKRSDGPPVTSRSMGGMRTLVSLQAISCRHSYTVREPTEVACIGGNRLKIARRTVTSAAHLIACLSMAASVVGRGWRH